ncbi:hypothetical protein Tco_0713297 [Tanacetum coccineum]
MCLRNHHASITAIVNDTTQSIQSQTTEKNVATLCDDCSPGPPHLKVMLAELLHVQSFSRDFFTTKTKYTRGNDNVLKGQLEMASTKPHTRSAGILSRDHQG